MVQVSQMTGTPLSLCCSDLPTLRLQEFVSYSSGVSTLVLVPIQVSAQVDCDSLYSFIGLSNLRDCDLPRDTTSLQIQEELLIFTFV